MAGWRTWWQGVELGGWVYNWVAQCRTGWLSVELCGWVGNWEE